MKLKLRSAWFQRLCFFHYIILSTPECLLSNSHLQISFPPLIGLNITLIITNHMGKIPFALTSGKPNSVSRNLIITELLTDV